MNSGSITLFLLCSSKIFFYIFFFIFVVILVYLNYSREKESEMHVAAQEKLYLDTEDLGVIAPDEIVHGTKILTFLMKQLIVPDKE